MFRTNISVASDKRHVLTDTFSRVTPRFNLYQLPALDLVKSFVPPKQFHGSRHMHKPTFAEQNTLAVAGSDHGNVYVFDVATGKQKQVLFHGDDAVGCVAAFSYIDRHVIVSGSSHVNFYSRKSVSLLAA